MCTCIKLKDWENQSVATEDITVYKKVSIYNGKVYAFYKKLLYIPDELEMEVFQLGDNNERCLDSVESSWKCDLIEPYVMITDGFHSMLNLEDMVKRIGLSNRYAVVEDFKKDRIFYDNDTRAALFIIPKGTKYMQNDVGCIVSNQIIFKHLINFNHESRRFEF